ncbi:MAG: hypothetical protein KDE22_06140, partial [Rhodobacterales bacterium]|nr:hypothetical protein [Rhodobacterales bacterium]
YGYSLMAIGLGRLFGFHFPMNFNRPYEALNGRDFWRRWHMTLSFWIRDYLYLPLGGNDRYVRNILIVFVVCGLWHGAGWTFIIWGAYHAAFVLAYHGFRGPWDALPAPLQRALTFTIVSVGWTLFLFDFQGIAAFAHSLLGRGVDLMPLPTAEMWAVLALVAVVCFAVRFETIIERRATAGAGLRSAGMAALFVATVLFIDRSNDFIYFRF